jgi:hypothetical protein
LPWRAIASNTAVGSKTVSVAFAPGWSLEPEVALRRPHLGGEVGEFTEQRWFPNASAWGFESAVSVRASLNRAWSAFLQADYLRYAVEIGSNPSSALAAGSTTELVQSVAGGATDQYLSLLVGVEFRLAPAGLGR